MEKSDDNSLSTILWLALIHIAILTMFALMIRYERWLIDTVGLKGAEILIAKTIALLLLGILLVRVLKLVASGTVKPPRFNTEIGRCRRFVAGF
jgi:hypothetical protein